MTIFRRSVPKIGMVVDIYDLGVKTGNSPNPIPLLPEFSYDNLNDFYMIFRDAMILDQWQLATRPFGTAIVLKPGWARPMMGKPIKELYEIWWGSTSLLYWTYGSIYVYNPVWAA